MKRRLRLGIDLDGVVVDFGTSWTRLYNAEHGTDLHPDDVTMWDAPVELTHFGSMAAFWKWAATADEGSSIFRRAPTLPGAIDALGRLAKQHRIVIVTTKPHYAIHDTYHWLADHRIPTSEVHIVHDKTTVDCDVYLDDGDHNLTALRHGRPNAVVCRFERAWNRPHDGVVDIDDWDAFEAVVATVAAAR